jgi:replicative DNA helicase
MSDMGAELQENVLTLLCFSAEHVGSIVENVKPETFDNEVYADIAREAIKYYRKYQRPVADHLPDVLFKKKMNKDKARIVRGVLSALNDYSGAVNTRYVMDELNTFLRAQSLKKRVLKALEYYNSNDLDAAELEIKKVGGDRVNTFDPGVFFGKDVERTLSFMHHEDHLYSTGIEQLDELGIAPVKGELFVYVALPGHGKSWGMMHVTKANLLQRVNVAYITLEMSEAKVSQRLVQSMFAVSKSSREVVHTAINTNVDGVVTSMSLKHLTNIRNFKQEGIETAISDRLRRHRRSHGLVIKQFPTGQLTIDSLRAYLENLATFYHFFPEIVVIDYADLMQLDAAHLRVDTGRVYKDLRGLAVELGIAIVTASQANRAGEGAKLLTRKNLAEDFSKVAIADNVITYNQTPQELERGLARLYVDKARNDRRGDLIVLTQDYTIGQFCLQSARINHIQNYDEMLNAVPTVSNINTNNRRRGATHGE